jgi:type II secretory pathway component GspD/PulD (secretin)
LPLAGAPPVNAIELSQHANGNIDLSVRNQSLSLVLSELAKQQGLNIVASNDIDALISITLRDVPLEEALTAILSVANYTWVQRNGIILITSLSDSATLPAEVQGRQIQVFELNFASAVEIEKAVTNLLTPGVGKVSTSATDPVDNRRTRELVVVEDLPDALARIAAYIQQVDQLPRQVLIEAHVLQVTLTDETRCGVDFHALCRLAGSDINFFGVPGISSATTTPSPGIGLPGPIDPPAFVATFTSSDLNAVIQALETTTDSKTLGSPKLLVLNGQQAHIQVGETIYYQQTTTTETTTQAGAASVETGVILRLTPRITEDGRVLLRVEPQVSSPTGERPSPELPPNIARIELQSDVMLRDGEGMIIGGLIDERDVTTQQKLPYLGEVKGLGWLFRHSITTKERSEIIFALVPRIQPYSPEYQLYEQGELVRAGVPLMEGPLCRTNRPWDPVLPDGKRVYRPLVPKKPHQVIRRGRRDTPYVVPPQPWPVQRFPDPQWDARWQGATAHGPHHPLLSDEVMALPPQVDVEPTGEIITDQN